MRYLALINEIEAELRMNYLPGAIQWADETHEFAWSNAIDRFDKALATHHDSSQIQVEAEIYKSRILQLLKEFKEHSQLDEKKLFLEGLKEQYRPDPGLDHALDTVLNAHKGVSG